MAASVTEEDIVSERRPLAWVAAVLAIVGVTMMSSAAFGAAPASSDARGTSAGLKPGVVRTGAVTGVAAAAAATVAGSQGIDTAIADTPSAVTVRGHGTFSNVTVKVNQTKSLTNQTVSVSWTGATPTVQGPGRFGSQFMQIMQCWGEDDGSNPSNPGPPPEQCEQGAVAGTYAGLPAGVFPGGLALSRIISRTTWPNYSPTVGVKDPKSINVWMPFRAVDGTEVGAQVDAAFNPQLVGGNYWLNPYYNIITTNEIAGAVNGDDGKGAELFQVVTGVESAGLGCGQKVQPVPGGGLKRPKCWIVVVPRGTAADENGGTPFADTAEQWGVFTSPVAPDVWQNRIAIPVEFNPVESACALGSDELRISGSEMALPAVASWQVPLCGQSSLQPFAYAPVSDDSARLQLSSGVTGGPSMIVVSKPLSTVNADPASPAIYAPISLSGIVIGFNIERIPKTDAPVEQQRIAGVRVADLHLTPRVLAKLLTQSYAGAVRIEGSTPYDWAKTSPLNMGQDPDFLQFNPEFAELQIGDNRAFSGLTVGAGNNDAAEQVWKYVLADPEARAWLSGKPDQWGMKVNPVYNITTANPTGIPFASPVPNSFPKSDPYCYQAPVLSGVANITPPALCGTDWMPYSRGMAESARFTRAAFDGAKIVPNAFAISTSDAWQRDVPQYLGRRSFLSITDTSSADLFGVQVASLSRAGDNSAARVFVKPDKVGLTAGVKGMSPKTESSFLEPDPLKKAAGGYPLTTLTYAAIKPLSLDRDTRRQFSEFLKYAGGAGQSEGLELGKLPRGYAPLPSALRSQTLAAASTVKTMKPVPTTTTTTEAPSTTPTTTTPTTTAITTTTYPITYPTTPVITPPYTTDPTTPTTATSSTTTTTTATTVPGTSAPVTTPPTTTVPSLTPPDAPVRGRLVVPGLGIASLGSALGVLEISKRPRRKHGKKAA
jgi:hypothetical protein